MGSSRRVAEVIEHYPGPVTLDERNWPNVFGVVIGLCLLRRPP